MGGMFDGFFGNETGREEATNRMPAFQREYLTGTVLPFARRISETPFTPFTGQRAAPVSPLAMGTESLYRRVADVSAMTPANFAARTAANLNPYQSQVINASLDRLRREEDIQRSAERALVARQGAFGNERRGVFEAEREAARDLNRDQLVASLMQQGYNQAQAQTMAQIAAQQAAALAGAQGLTGLGALEQATAQTGLDAAYQEFIRGQEYPLTQLGALTGAAGVIPTGYGTTTSVESEPGAGLSRVLGTASSIMGLFSDRRLKKNVTKIAEINGVNYYTWEWNDTANALGAGDQPRSGVIADELREIHPDLVIRGDDGYLRVDYAGLAKRQELQPA